MKEKRPRRRLFVNSRYQLTQAGVTVFANVAVVLLMTGLLSWFYLLFFKGEIICSHNRLLPVVLAVITLGIVLVSTVWSLRRSRIVAGMMRKLDTLMNEAARGVLPEQPLVFRKGDYFGSLAGPLNGCFSRMTRQRTLSESVGKRLREVSEKIRSGELREEETAGVLEEIAADLSGTSDDPTAN